ncbi:MAG: plasmid stabilization protein [Chloroflexi bacterium]|nr:plasmid stabilization protein [Chloroflexota bacterium]
MYTITTAEHFLRRSAKFFRKPPELRDRFRHTAELLRANPWDPGLRLHALRGQLEGVHAVSLTYEYRIVLTIKITEREIILLDIGSHDEVYR